MRLSVAPSTRSAVLHRASSWLRILLPWPMIAWCEAIYFTRYGEIELRMVKHLCKPDRDSIDVGTNVGPYLHAMIGHSREVYAFEPIPWLAQLLAKKFGQKIIVNDIALSGEASTAVLRVPIIDGKLVTGLATLSDYLATTPVKCRDIPVETRPLDDVYFGNVGFIKIDVEGYEDRVLQGAQRTLERCRPRVLIEAEEHHSPGSVRRIQAFFNRLGYRGYFVFQSQLTPVEHFDPERMQRSEDIADYGFGTPRARFERYINNFLFLPADELSTTLTQLDAALMKRAPRGTRAPGRLAATGWRARQCR
jgi:FkbM family methyltransferase